MKQAREKYESTELFPGSVDQAGWGLDQQGGGKGQGRVEGGTTVYPTGFLGRGVDKDSNVTYGTYKIALRQA